MKSTIVLTAILFIVLIGCTPTVKDSPKPLSEVIRSEMSVVPDEILEDDTHDEFTSPI
jgi:hypothetical protein